MYMCSESCGEIKLRCTCQNNDVIDHCNTE